jgi:cytochrome c biogenesis protein
MRPVDMGDGVPVFLLGVRDSGAESFRYLRVPADDQDSMDGFMHLLAALHDPAERARAVQRYVAKVVDPKRPELAEQLAVSATRALDLFAGAGHDASTGGAPLAACRRCPTSSRPRCRRASASARPRCCCAS